jgi:hypothetical protein
MKFKDFELKENNHFIAMQYFGLILNRTFLVLLTNEFLIGIKVNGLVSVEGGGNIFVKEVTTAMAIRGDLDNPYSYMKAKYIDRIQNYDILDGSILTQNKANFVIKKLDIKNAHYDPRKKWGMGYYPHDGKVYVETLDGKKKELIVLGNQSGDKIAKLIK